MELQIEGRYAYGYLAGEKGTHRIVRISPFSPKGSSQRHTSFAAVEVMPVLGERPSCACHGHATAHPSSGSYAATSNGIVSNTEPAAYGFPPAQLSYSPSGPCMSNVDNCVFAQCADWLASYSKAADSCHWHAWHCLCPEDCAMLHAGERASNVDIPDNDLEISTMRAGGAGAAYAAGPVQLNVLCSHL